jgi:hypothetical protein
MRRSSEACRFDFQLMTSSALLTSARAIRGSIRKRTIKHAKLGLRPKSSNGALERGRRGCWLRPLAALRSRAVSLPTSFCFRSSCVCVLRCGRVFEACLSSFDGELTFHFGEAGHDVEEKASRGCWVTMYGPSPDCKQDHLMEEAVCFYVCGFWVKRWCCFEP